MADSDDGWGDLAAEPEPDPQPVTFSALADEATEQEWIIDDILPAGAQAIVAGAPKASRKTYLLLYLAKCVSEGTPFLGRTVRRRPVIFVALEGGRKRLARRAKQLGFGHEKQPDLSDLDRGACIAYFGIPGYERALEDLAHRQVLVIVDPLARAIAHKGLNENAAPEVTDFLRVHEELICQGPESSLVWLHHFRKSRDMMRGSTAYEAGTDGWWENHATDEDRTLRIEVTLRDGASQVIGARFVVLADGTFAFEAVEPPARKAPGPPRAGTRNGKPAVSREASDADAVRRALYEDATGAMNRDDVRRAAGISRDRAGAALELLMERGEAAYGARVGQYKATGQLRELMDKRRGLSTLEDKDSD